MENQEPEVSDPSPPAAIEQPTPQVFSLDGQTTRDPKEVFYESFRKIIEKKDSMIKTKAEYEKIMAQIVQSKQKPRNELTSSERYLAKKYTTYTIADTTRMIKQTEVEKALPKIFLYEEEIYDEILKAHLAVGHGGRDRTHNHCKQWFENITVEAVVLFISCCIVCSKKQRINTTNLVIKPLRSTDYLARTQIDLIDLQSFPDGRFKWIMTIQDHFTKFVHLRALERKKAEEVAKHLFDIFLVFGAPQILQSDNGKEFRAKVVEEIKLLWPDLKIVHGRPRHPQSQGSVERANAEVKRLLRIWICETKRKDWSIGIKFVANQYNRAKNRNLESNPFHLVFGVEYPEGLRSTIVPPGIWNRLASEKDLLDLILPNEDHFDDDDDEDEVEEAPEILEALKEVEAFEKEALEKETEAQTQAEAQKEKEKKKKTRGRKSKLTATQTSVETVEPTQRVESVQAASAAAEDVVPKTSEVNKRRHLLREANKQRQEKTIEKIVAKANAFLPAAKVGDKVAFFVSQFDRGISDPPVILSKVYEIKNDMYRLATEAGLLEGYVPRDAFQVVSQLVDFTVTNTPILPMRAIVTALSVGGGQGFLKCGPNCTCSNNKCKCKRGNVLCNSRCHGNRKTGCPNC